MASKKTVTREPMACEDILHAIELTRRLVSMSAEQIRQAKLDLDLAKLGLAELTMKLSEGGVKP